MNQPHTIILNEQYKLIKEKADKPCTVSLFMMKYLLKTQIG